MMPSRIYDFTTGYDQVTAPDAATPSAIADLATVGYGVSNYAIYVADVAAVKAIGATFRANGKACFVDSITAWFYFDSASSATGDDVLVITPTAGTGRWIRTNVTSLGATQDVATATTIAALASSTPVVRLTGSTATTIQGITAGISSQVLLIYNVSSAEVTLAHQNGTASAADRLALSGAVNLVIPAGGSALLRYDTASTRWTPAEASGSAAASGLISVSAVKTTTYAILTSDELVLTDATSGSFTATLPTAAGVTGKKYTIKRTDQTLANAVTIATTSSQTIDGVTTRKLATQNEAYTVVSDGSNWIVLDHTIPGSTTNYAPTLNNSSNVTTNDAYWMRKGSKIEIEGYILYGGAGSGAQLSVSLPTDLTIDTSRASVQISELSSWGHFHYLDNGTNYRTGNCTYLTSTTFALNADSSGGGYANTQFAANDKISYKISMPITNWED